MKKDSAFLTKTDKDPVKNAKLLEINFRSIRNKINLFREIFDKESPQIIVTAIKFKLKTHQLFLIAMYRSPSASTTEDWDTFIKKKTQELILTTDPFCNKILLKGDLNINTLDSSKKTKEFLDLLEAANLSPTFNQSTRRNLLSGNDSSSDNIFTNSVRPIDHQIIRNYKLLDHDILSAKINLGANKPITQYKIGRKVNEETMTLLEIQLSTEDWTNVFNSEDPNQAYNEFLEIFLYYYNTICPVLKSKISPDKKKIVNFSVDINYYHNMICFLESILPTSSNRESVLKSIKLYRSKLKLAYDIKRKRVNE
ncbi:putative tRNA sulfurtransferase [Frankliniella fusca]|uniref:tRNA sulfurtransferase n=1 Tax=Frankliniella fusca TaxID=407009 RepID=A0AAE1LRI0_9NEOP|nr:putative tRNA sulfurtransferase [Frankliniella fusca]